MLQDAHREKATRCFFPPPLRDTTDQGGLSIPSVRGITVGSVGKLFKATTNPDTLSLRSQVGKGQERSETPGVSAAHPLRRRPSAAGGVPGAGGEARPGRDGGGALAGRLGPVPGPCPPAPRCGQAGVMACRDAHRGAELLDFAQFRASSTQPLAYGYAGRSLQELRAREFGRLAGETGGGASLGLAGRPWRARSV